MIGARTLATLFSGPTRRPVGPYSRDAASVSEQARPAAPTRRMTWLQPPTRASASQS